MEKTALAKPRAGPRLPSLDLLKGFEAAARQLSFTRAAEELFLTQSALSRQMQTLEEQIGFALFERRHRELRLTDAGQILQATARNVLDELAQAVAKIRREQKSLPLTVSTNQPFASVWLIPRLARFRARHPAADRARPLKRPEDLARHVLLHIDDERGRFPWLNWSVWLAANGIDEIESAGSLRFNHFDQVMQAALDGQGVALGRVPLIDSLLAQGRLVAPFPNRYATTRSYFIVRGTISALRPEAQAFIDWLIEEAAAESALDVSGQPKPARKP